MAFLALSTGIIPLKAQASNEAKETLLGQSESEIDKIFRERQEEMQAKKKMDE